MWAVTSEITVNYFQPVPLNKPLSVESRKAKKKGCRLINVAELLNGKGEVLARAAGLFIAIDACRIFGKLADK